MENVTGVSMERVTQFNEKLTQLQQEASKLQSSIEFHKARLNDTCSQLTKLLGTVVTPDNLMQVYEDYMKKVRNTLETGEDIMRRIDEQKMTTQVTQTPVTAAPAPAPTPAPAPGGVAPWPAGPWPVQTAKSTGFTTAPTNTKQVPVAEPAAMPSGASAPAQVPSAPTDEPVPVQVPFGIPATPQDTAVPPAPSTQPVVGAPQTHVWGAPGSQGQPLPDGPIEI